MSWFWSPRYPLLLSQLANVRMAWLCLCITVSKHRCNVCIYFYLNSSIQNPKGPIFTSPISTSWIYICSKEEFSCFIGTAVFSCNHGYTYCLVLVRHRPVFWRTKQCSFNFHKTLGAVKLDSFEFRPFHVFHNISYIFLWKQEKYQKREENNHPQLFFILWSTWKE